MILNILTVCCKLWQTKICSIDTNTAKKKKKKKKKKKTSITEYGQAKTTYSYKINVSFCFHGNRKLSDANATFYAQSNTLEHI